MGTMTETEGQATAPASPDLPERVTVRMEAGTRARVSAAALSRRMKDGQMWTDADYIREAIERLLAEDEGKGPA